MKLQSVAKMLREEAATPASGSQVAILVRPLSEVEKEAVELANNGLALNPEVLEADKR